MINIKNVMKTLKFKAEYKMACDYIKATREDRLKGNKQNQE